MARRDRRAIEVGSGSGVAVGEHVDKLPKLLGGDNLRRNDAFDKTQLSLMGGLLGAFEHQRVNETASETDAYPHPRLRRVGVFC